MSGASLSTNINHSISISIHLLTRSDKLPLHLPLHVHVDSTAEPPGYLLVHDGARHLPDLTQAQLRGVQQHRLPAHADLDVERDHTFSTSSSTTATSSSCPPQEGERAGCADQRRSAHECAFSPEVSNFPGNNEESRRAGETHERRERGGSEREEVRGGLPHGTPRRVKSSPAEKKTWRKARGRGETERQLTGEMTGPGGESADAGDRVRDVNGSCGGGGLERREADLLK